MLSQRSIIPGFGLSFGLTIGFLSILVLLPLSALFLRTAGLGWAGFVEFGLSSRAVAAYGLSFGASAIAAVINIVSGGVIAWVLVRYDFPGRKILSAMVDLPFALPTAVAGIALVTLCSANGVLGKFAAHFGLSLAFNRVGIVIALVFVGLPFVVRAVEPVLADLKSDFEEAAASLGASRSQTFFRVLLPEIFPALLTGGSLAFARGIGEYGSVIFIAGNIPFHTEIAPLLIVTQLEQYNYEAAMAIAVVMLLFSLLFLLFFNFILTMHQRKFQ